jgi:hypothetical protein
MQNPAFFKGTRRKRRYFEGWYFKCISADRQHAVALIPGMAVDPLGNRHAFIQVIQAVTGQTAYHRFEYRDFSAATDRLDIRIADHSFSTDGLSVQIDRPEGSVKGRLTFSDVHAFPVSRLNPGIMGPFSFVPFMECYHAIIHLYHAINGSLQINGEILSFDGGVGYIEKDYGRSFPKTYFWLQASHFEAGNASFVFSRARIPFLGREFPGFFAYFTDFTGISVRFATYNHSKLTDWAVDAAAGTCRGRLEGPEGILTFSARMAGGGRLRAPIDGLMDREIIESITARVSLRLTSPDGKVLYESSSGEAGMEISL